jgi:hypothetical protein
MYNLIYKPQAGVVPIINNVAYDTSELTSNVTIGTFESQESARYWVSRHLRFGTLAKSVESIYQDSFISGWGAPNNPTADGPYTRPVPPQGLTGIKKIKLGPFHGIAILSNNKVTGWGTNTYGQINQVALNNLDGSKIKKIEAGMFHTLFLFNNGTISGMGWTDVKASNGNYLTGVEDISAGSYHSLALLKNRNVTGWGGSSAGNAYNVPMFLQTGGVTVQISAGTTHSLALINSKFSPLLPSYPEYQLNKKIITGWGSDQTSNNQASKLLTGEYRSDMGYAGVVEIRAGAWHSLAILEKWVRRTPDSEYYDRIRTVTGWGRNDPPINNNVGPNINLANGGDRLTFVENIYVAPYHNIVQFFDGSITGWGRTSAYQNLNAERGRIKDLSINYDYNIAIREVSTPASWNEAEISSSWPFNDLYFKGGCGGNPGTIDLVPC